MNNPAVYIRDLTLCIQAATADCISCLELGCGFGDKLASTRCATLLGIDAHRPYLDEAARRYPQAAFMQGEVETLCELFCTDTIDAVLIVDFIEHLERKSAKQVLRQVERIARKRVVTFVPIGEHPQDSDATGLGGDHWQTHRSTWQEHELVWMGFDVVPWKNWFDRSCKGRDAAFCIKEIKR